MKSISLVLGLITVLSLSACEWGKTTPEQTSTSNATMNLGVTKEAPQQETQSSTMNIQVQK